MITLKGKTALVTGATGGMGKEIALGLAREGVHLVLLGRNQAKLDGLRELIEGNSAIHIKTVSLGLEDNIEEAASELASELDQLDILVYAAGSIIPNTLDQVTGGEYERQFNINFHSAFTLVRALIPRLKESSGQIVMINSSVIKNAKADLPVYTASKHALAGFTESLRQEVNPSGIRVVNIVPGKTATGMQEELARNMNVDMRSDSMIQPYDIAYTVLQILKLPYTAEITDVFIRPMRK